MQNIFLSFDVHRVPGVIPALGSNHDIRLLGQNVNDLAFAFIAPLGANENRIGHKSIKIPECKFGAKLVKSLRAEPRKRP